MDQSRSKYSVYGLTVGSEFDLPELLPAPPERDVDVTIRLADLNPAVGSDTDPETQRVDATPDRCRLTYDSVGTFLIEEGHRIRCDPASLGGETHKIFRRVLENQAMTVVMLQRGLLVLHASAVVVSGAAAVFVGSRTAGKSTTTAAFHRRGHSMLADDVVAIRFEDGQSTVVPGVPQIRLSPEAADALELDPVCSYDRDWDTEKVYYPIEAQADATPLGSIYSLEDTDHISIEPFEGLTPFFELVTNTYAQGLLPDTRTTADHFGQCSQVVASTPVRLLRRPKRFDRLPEVVDLVAADVRGASEHADASTNYAPDRQ